MTPMRGYVCGEPIEPMLPRRGVGPAALMARAGSAPNGPPLRGGGGVHDDELVHRIEHLGARAGASASSQEPALFGECIDNRQENRRGGLGRQRRETDRLEQ